MTIQNEGNQRDELAAIYVDTLNKGHGVIDRPEQGERAADAILAAGYRKPRTITTVEELDGLDGLGEGSVVLDGEVCVRRADGYWKVSDLAGAYASAELTFPVTVLYEPEAEKGA